MKHIFQIGDMRLHWHANILDHESEYETSSNSTQFPLGFGTAWPNSQWHYKERTVTVSGMLIGDAHRSMDMTLQALRRWVGRPTSIIAYDLLDPRTIFDCGCQAGEYCEDIYWLHNYGRIASVDVTPSESYRFPELEVTFNLQGFWEPLDPYLWYWGSTPEHPMRPRTLMTNVSRFLSAYPRLNELFNRVGEGKLWVRRQFYQTNFLYDPTNWVATDYHDIITGSVGYYDYYCDPNVWGAPPMTWYAFSNFQLADTLTLRVQSQDGFSYVEHGIEFSFQDINDDLQAAGYGGLQLTDVVLIGEFKRLPGLILRNGVPLPFSPTVDHEERLPGMLRPGHNYIVLESPQGIDMTVRIAKRRL